MKASISILSTKHLDPTARDWALAQDWGLMEMEFIQIEALPLNRSQERRLDAIGPSDLVVVTSENAIKFLPTIQSTETWRFGCIGHKTRYKVQERFPHNQIRFTADNSRDLAAQIVESKCFGDVYFICAEDHRMELSLLLQKHRIKVETFSVYKTIKQPQKVDHHYDGILFFSPSGVESFFQLNQSIKNTIYAAIGQTTANALENYTKRVIISEAPTQEALLRCVQSYYENHFHE